MNVGVLGFAHGHAGAYLGRWKADPALGVEVVAGWDPDPARLAAAAARQDLRPYASAEALLGEASIGGVLIAAETSRHAALVEQAAAAGKAIVLQKPLALTMAEADRIVGAVRAAGVPFTLAWQMRVDPQNLRMREMVRSGVLGKVFMVRRRHGLSMILTNPDFRSTWHLRPELNRDIWADDAAHPVDFLYWLFGMPETVAAELATLHDPVQPNDHGIAVFRFPGGLLAEVCCSFACLAGENTTEIIAERGVVVQNFGDGPSTGVPRPPGGIGLKWYPRGAGGWVVDDAPAPRTQWDRVVGLAEPLAAFLNGRRGPIATAEEGRDALRMVLACYVASREGRRVRLDDPKIAEV